MFESEYEIHKELEKYRVNKGKEFFNLPLDKAKKIVQKYGPVYYDSPKNSENVTVLRQYKGFKEYKILIGLRTICEQSNVTI